MTKESHQNKIQNWLDNQNIFEIIKDRNRIDTIIKEIDNQSGHVNIDILQFANIFSLYQKLNKERKTVVERISQTDDWGLRLKIGEELTAIENEEKQFLKNVLYTAHTFTDIRLQGKIENVAESFFTGNIEKANELLNPTQLETEQDKVLQLVQAQTKLEQAYDSLEDNANEFKVKAQLTVLSLDTNDATNRLQKAIYFFERGYLSATYTNRKTFIARFAFQNAQFLEQYSRFEDAKRLYQTTISVYRKQFEKKESKFLGHLAVALKSLGKLLVSTNEIMAALELYIEALYIEEFLVKIEPNKFLSHISSTWDVIGTLESLQKEYLQAASSYNKALDIRRELAQNNPLVYLSKVASTLNNLAILQKERLDFNKSEKLFEEALSIYSQIITTKHDYSDEISLILNNLANLKHDKKELNKAEELYKKALSSLRKKAEKYPNRYLKLLAQTLNNLANVQCEQTKFHEAKKSYKEALKINRPLALLSPQVYRAKLAMTLSNLTNLYLDKEEFEKAKVSCEEAFIIYEELYIKDNQVYLLDLARVRNNLGNVNNSQNKPRVAIKHYKASLKLYQQYPKTNQSTIAMVFGNLGICYKEIFSFNQAERYYLAALKINRQLATLNPTIRAFS